MKKKIGIISLLAASALAVGALTPLAFSQSDSVNESIKLTNGHSKGKNIYVSPDGSADAPGTDPSAPTTFYNAHTTASAGDVILLSGGNYVLDERQQLGVREEGATDTSNVVTGTYDNYITIMPNPNNTGKVVFDFSGMETLDANRGIQIYSDYWYIKDIEVYGAGDNGIYVAGSHNIVENCLFYGNRDTGLQIGRAYSSDSTVDSWPTCNLIKNCTSFANYDYSTFGENADGFAAKLTVGYGNIFDGCIAARNSDDGWDLFAKVDSGDIGTVIIYNSVSFENGFLPYKHFREGQDMTKPASELELTYDTLNGDGIGFKLGGSTMKGNVIVENSMTFDNKLHGVGDNSNPGVIQVSNLTAFNNCAGLNDDGTISVIRGLPGIQNKSNNIDLARSIESYNSYYGVLSYINNQAKRKIGGVDYEYSTANDSSYNKDSFRGSTAYSIFNTSFSDTEKYVAFTGWEDASSYRTATEDLAFSDGVEFTRGLKDSDFKDLASINAKIDIALDGTTYSWKYEDETLKDNSFRDELANVTSDIHDSYRNTDHSVNMGDHLALSDTASDLKTYADGKPVGCVLNNDSWDKYKHYDMIDFYDNDFGTLTENQIAVKSALSICEAITRYDATYQDFRLPKLLHNTDISWTSSNTDVINIEYSEEYSVSWSAFSWARITVPENDTEVTLTATATSGKVSESKEIKLTVKGRHQTLGDIVSTGADAIRVNIYGSLIAPRLYPTDNSSIVASELPKSLYDMTYKIRYASDGNSKFYTIIDGAEDVTSNVYTSVPGVYEITATAVLKSDPSFVSTYSYKVYVVDPDCDIDFMVEKTSDGKDVNRVTLSQDGFVVTGRLSNIEGDVVGVWSTTPLSLSSAADLIARSDAQYVKISTDSIVAEFNADNRTLSTSATQYYLYYAVVNANRSNASKNPVYSTEIKVVNIDSEQAFYNMAKTGKANGESLSVNTIYSLTRDLDFTGFNYSISATAVEFTGLFRGNNHTISNISINETGHESNIKTVNVVSKISNGTFMDVKFDNISIIGDSGVSKQVGIIGELQGGYIANVHATRINSSGKESIGGIIGQVTGGINYISNCSLVNPYADYMPLVETNTDGDSYFVAPDASGYTDGRLYYNSLNDYQIHATNKYAGGIIGNAQKNSDQSTFKLYVHDCYVDAVIGDGNDAGGNTGLIISRIKNDDVVYYTEVYNNYARGLVISKGQYNAGIIGDLDNGSGTVVINSNIAEVDFLYNGIFLNAERNKLAGMKYAHKNSSSIVGRPVTNPMGQYITGYNYGLWGEYYDKIVISSSMVYDLWDDDKNVAFTISQELCSNMGFDFDNTWTFVAGAFDETNNVWTVRPSLKLKAIA